MNTKIITNRENIVAIANAVRDKTGKTESLTLGEIADEINDIEAGNDTSDATATSSEIFKDKTAYTASGKVTGTFTIDEELSTQEDLIGQIQTALEGKASGGGSDSTLQFLLEGDITEANSTSLTKIRNYAFYYYDNLTTVAFPECISIGEAAFNTCSNLREANFAKCTEIKPRAFMDCMALTAVAFPLCSIIGSQAFFSCHSLVNANFPMCESIGSSAFFRCSTLSSLNLPMVKYIATGAFRVCNKLANLTIMASSVATLENSATFAYTPISDSSYIGFFGSIYVPASLVSAYKAATNWAIYADRITAIV